MRRKHFRLERLLDIRIMAERSAAAVLSEADTALQKVQEELRILKEKESALYDDFIHSLKTQGNLASIQAHLSAVKEDYLLLSKKLKEREDEKSKAYSLYINALKKRKILENLKDKTLESAKNS